MPAKDGRKNNGGHKTAGRKPKVQEQTLIENLDAYIQPKQVSKILAGCLNDDKHKRWAVPLYLSYRYGKPKENVDVTSGGEVINLPLVRFVAPEDDATD